MVSSLQRTVLILKYRLAYTQKGFRESLTFHGDLIYSNRNELDYLSIDFLVLRTWREGFFRPYVAAGFSGTALVRKEVADSLGNSNSLGILAISPDGFNTLGIGDVYNLGATLGKAFFIEVGYLIDMLPALNRPDVKIRNLLFTVATGVHLSALLNKE